MDHRGYSKRIMDANAKADASSLGVLLGRYCIEHDISAVEIAKIVRVSKMTIYKWFTGEWEPRPQYLTRIEAILKTLKR